MSILLLTAWVHESIRARLATEFPNADIVDARERPVLEEKLPAATIVYGQLPAELAPKAHALRWLQLNSAGVPLPLCDALRGTDVRVTNLAGLYGPTIAEHAVALMLMLARNLHQALHQQQQTLWQRDLASTMSDLHGKTAAIVGLGNIGQNIARLCRGFGMRVMGCRRTSTPTSYVDLLFPVAELRQHLSEADFVIVAAPLTRETDGMLGPAEFQAMKRGAFFINVSRGAVAQEAALVDALHSGRLGGAGLDAYVDEPLLTDHPFWTMPQVIVSPHYSGETVNNSALPGELFLRNLRAFMEDRPLNHVVDLTRGY